MGEEGREEDWKEGREKELIEIILSNFMQIIRKEIEIFGQTLDASCQMKHRNQEACCFCLVWLEHDELSSCKLYPSPTVAHPPPSPLPFFFFY